MLVLRFSGRVGQFRLLSLNSPKGRHARGWGDLETRKNNSAGLLSPI